MNAKPRTHLIAVYLSTTCLLDSWRDDPGVCHCIEVPEIHKTKKM